MPNWVKNIVRFDTDKVIKECVRKENGRQLFDFNKIIPMPKVLEDDGDFDKLTQEERLLFLKENDNCDDWYSWRLRYWGCKWNTSNTYVVDKYTVEFETPWGMPDKIYEAISEKYKTVVRVIYADECYGYNCGRAKYENGVEVDYESKNGDEEFSENVWGSDEGFEEEHGK